ncbi:MAG: NADH-quinone oxidoreductase subunit NuoH [Dehalococcoidia bacterium]|nr:NADH-quinone oxidoreductase subunit NuoH [Dehalococcoidia bacterium]
MPSPLEGNALFRGIYCWLAAGPGNAQYCTPAVESVWRDGLLPTGWEWLAFTVAALAIVALVVNVFLVMVMLYTYLERRLLGRFQARLGPNRTGPFGLLQPVADAIKLLTKEDLVPADADRWVFNLAPVVMVVPVILVLAVLPFGRHSFVADVNIGILYVVAVTSVSTLAMFMAGFASGNRYAMFGGMRAVAQLISYEIPVVLSIVGVLLLAGSLSLVSIVEAQRIPYILLQPLGFFVFMAGSSAEMNRSPFDLVEAESEIVSGYHTEYSGMKFGVFQLAEFGAVLTTSGIMATLFLKGWEGPVLPSHLWFLIKVFFFAFLFIWVRATLPRLRIDQVMAFAWKFLLPLSLINIFVTAIEVLALDTTKLANLWLMAGINIAVAVVGIAAFSRFVRLGGQPRDMTAEIPMAAEAR